MHRVDQNLTFEFSNVLEDGSREFVISANGIKSSFRSVEALYATAPWLRRWKFLRFRQRRRPLNAFKFRFGPHFIAASKVHYALFRDTKPGKVGIMLFLDGYSAKDRDSWDKIGYLFLDAALGEYDVETHVGNILILGRDSEHFRKARHLDGLAGHFDKMLGRGVENEAHAGQLS